MMRGPAPVGNERTVGGEGSAIANVSDERPRILTFADYYLPGYKAGGPVRSIANLIEAIGDEFHFLVVTRDRDLADAVAYEGVVVGAWQPYGKGHVWYLAPGQRTPRYVRALIHRTPHQVLYVNSLFSPVFTIQILLLRRLGLLPPAPVVLSPKGEASPGALAVKALKKRLYLTIAKGIGLYDRVIWQASSPYEADDIRAQFGPRAEARGNIHVAPDLPSRSPSRAARPDSRKVAGTLRLVFLSRISPKKNLAGALEILRDARGDVRFDIYGPLEDQAYWAECERQIRRLPGNVQARYRGALRPEQVPATLSRYDLFFLLTHSENYGHVILEALAAGCPVLISDQTPWRHLEERGVGWDVALGARDRVRSIIERCVAMASAEHHALSLAAAAFAASHTDDSRVVEYSRQLFRLASGSGGDRALRTSRREAV
jgi:glycosyltransferase involved in cell wall biosynthesis